MKKTAFIINPKSATGNTVKLWHEVQVQLQRRLGAFEYFFTEYPKHATKLTSDLIEKGYDRLVLMGGDGTLHEVINGYLDSNGKVKNEDVKIGILNSGRGCDFIKTVSLPTDPLKAISKLVDMNFKKIDVGQITIKENEKLIKFYFANSSSFGLGGEVAKSVARKDSLLPPQFMYLSASLMSLYQAQPIKMKFEIDHEDFFEKEVMNVFIMNGRYSGGGMAWAPEALIDDGLLDLVIIEKTSKLRLALMAPKVYDGTFKNLPEVYYKKVKKVKISVSSPLWLETDGEVLQASSVEFESLSKVVSFIC